MYSLIRTTLVDKIKLKQIHKSGGNQLLDLNEGNIRNLIKFLFLSQQP